MANEETVLYRLENGIARITLNRPEVLNAINREMLQQLAALLERTRADTTVRGVLISGGDARVFSAGADIKYLHQASALEVRELAHLAVAVNHQIETLGKIVVAALNGDALGGGLELAEACTLRVAVRHAKLGHPEVRIGAVAGFGGTTRFPRLIGKGRAAELLLTGRLLGAEEALRIGLINRVVDARDLDAESASLIREIGSHSPTAVRMTWEALHRGLQLTPQESALLGADYFGLVACSDEFRAQTKAFLEKRE